VDLRKLLTRPGCAVAVGAHDPAVAKLVEAAGFAAVYVSGSASSTVVGGFADLGLLSFKEMLDHAAHVIAATELPVLCDVDTGFGGPTIVKRTVREYELIGAAGIHIEDQTFPKRCGQTEGATLIGVDEMCAKIAAAKEAQRDDALVVVARTDARQCEGLRGMIARARAYVDAGADAIFPEALLSTEELRQVREEIDAPLVADVPEWGRSPTTPVAELSGAGLSLAIFAVSTMRVALFAVRSFLADLALEQTQQAWLDRMVTRDELDLLLGLSRTREDEQRLADIGARLANEPSSRVTNPR
jgi:methylisocitrate lyase